MTKKSANTTEGHCQEVCFFDNIHLEQLEPKILIFKVLCQVSDVLEGQKLQRPSRDWQNPLRCG